MPTRAMPIGIGPWPGGINTLSDASAVDDSEAVDILNFDIDFDGSLKSRPSIIPTAAAGGRYDCRLLGIYTQQSGTSYVIFSCTDSAGANPSTAYYNINTGAFGTVTATFAATAMVQYNNKAWLVAPPGSANPGGGWDGSVFTAVPTMAKGVTACIYKDTMFIGSGDLDTTNPSRIFWGPPADPSAAWTATFNFNVNNGDGQGIRKIYSFGGSIAIFKTRSTYLYAYDSDPLKGQVQIVQSTIGVDGLDCMVENDSLLYVLSNSDLYVINNWVWTLVNIKVPFGFIDGHTGNWSRYCGLSSIGVRVVVRYFDSYYVYNSKTRTFTRWLSTLTPGVFLKSPIVDTINGIDTYIGGNFLKSTAGANANRLFIMRDTITVADVEAYTASLRTKIYALAYTVGKRRMYPVAIPWTFKRMMWWGIDLLAKTEVDVAAIPITYGTPTYWKDLPPKTWGQMAPHTWGQPSDISVTVNDNVVIHNTSNYRMFIRFIKSLRFRQIQFTVSSNLDGTTTTGPFQVYSMHAVIINKELVPDKVN